MFNVDDCVLVDLPKIHNEKGNLTYLENNNHVPFTVKRLYYLYDIPMGSERGGHGHYELEQYIIAASGSFSFVLHDGTKSKEIFLNDPSKALYIRSGMWREIIKFSSGAICLVLASHVYSESDYIREFDEFLDYRKSKVKSDF